MRIWKETDAKYRVKEYKKSAFFHKIAEFLKNVLVVKSDN